MNDTTNVWNNTRPMREVRYLMQSSAPSWPGYMNRFLSGPGIASLVNTTSNGPALLFHARHPNNQGGAVFVEVFLPIAEAWGLGSRQRQPGWPHHARRRLRPPVQWLVPWSNVP
eukprot:COSAG02_NODE_4223_length_5615_cov_2.992386_5_plen_114_part_00